MNRLCWVALWVAALLTAGCSDSNKSRDVVLKPIAEHITGKWQMTGYCIFEDGKWEEQVNDDNVSMAMEFRPDGTELRVMTFPDGFTALAGRTWNVNEDSGVLSDDGAQMQVHKLVEDELVVEAAQSQDPGTGEVSQIQSRWIFRRATEQDRTMAERLVGKWTFSSSYEKVDGEWVDRKHAFSEEDWIEFKENGNMYSPVSESKWSVNGTTGLLRIEKAVTGDKKIQKIEMTDEDALVIYTNDMTGENEKIKDVLVRENK